MTSPFYTSMAEFNVSLQLLLFVPDCSMREPKLNHAAGSDIYDDTQCDIAA